MRPPEERDHKDRVQTCSAADETGDEAGDEALISSVYHAGRVFQKLSSHKKSMRLSSTAHSQSEVIFHDNPVFLVPAVHGRRASRQDVYRKLLVKCTCETMFIERHDKSSSGPGFVESARNFHLLQSNVEEFQWY